MKESAILLKWTIKPIVIVFILLNTTVLYGQTHYTGTKTHQLLEEISSKLAHISAVRYKNTREIFYKEENYQALSNNLLFIDFTSPGKTGAYRFQADDEKFFACYNGAHYFGLNKKEKTIDIKNKPGKELFESLSPLYNSLITVRHILPVLIANDSIQKKVRDTSIDKKEFYCVEIELYGYYFGNLGSLLAFTKEYTGDKRKPYLLIVDKKKLLPFQFIAKFKDRPADFIKTTFTDIDIKPGPPAELSWFYSSYMNEYDLPQAKKQLVSLGARPGDWTLPVYDPVLSDSVSLSQFRGKIIMLDFWIRSCGPCLASFPHLNKLRQKFGANTFELLSINTEDAKDDIARFHKKYKPQYKMLWEGEKLAEYYGVSAYPTIILLDKTGKVLYAEVGFDEKKIEKIIEENL